MNYFALWKHWIRPFAIMIYFILMMIAVPLCVVELTRKDPPDHVKAWFTGGVFVLLAVPISLWEILQHLIHYTQPHLQKYIIRILWMVPIYAMNAWFALRFTDAAIYLDTARECYEAYVIYNFMAYLLSYLWSEYPNLDVVLEEKPQTKHLIPFCCFPPFPMGSKMIKYCKHGVLQYTIVRPLTTLVALISEIFGKYDEGDFNFKSSWSYLVIVNNISQIWAMYCLVLFYKATREELKPICPVPKFLCVKFVVFFSFWQAVVIAVFAKLDWIPVNGEWDFYHSVKEIATGIQDLCICVEMFLAAVAHYFSFSHKPFINENADQVDCCVSFKAMLDISDVKDDVVEHVKVIGTTMKKTVSGPFLARQAAPESEMTPLLSANHTGPSQQVSADVHQGYLSESQGGTDWEVTSVERYSRPFAKSTTSSMNNYLDIDSSVEVHGAHIEEQDEDHDDLRQQSSSQFSDTQRKSSNDSGTRKQSARGKVNTELDTRSKDSESFSEMSETSETKIPEDVVRSETVAKEDEGTETAVLETKAVAASDTASREETVGEEPTEDDVSVNEGTSSVIC